MRARACVCGCACVWCVDVPVCGMGGGGGGREAELTSHARHQRRIHVHNAEPAQVCEQGWAVLRRQLLHVVKIKACRVALPERDASAGRKVLCLAVERDGGRLACGGVSEGRERVREGADETGRRGVGRAGLRNKFGEARQSQILQLLGQLTKASKDGCGIPAGVRADRGSGEGWGVVAARGDR